MRKSVIRFGGRTYDYPLNLPNLLKTAPLALMAGAVKDLLLLPFAKKPTDFAKASFAEWIQSHFGRTLYRQFFEGYTAKLWGINPDKLSADWAGQRISLIDLKDVARRLPPRRSGSMSVRTYMPASIATPSTASARSLPPWGSGWWQREPCSRPVPPSPASSRSMAASNGSIGNRRVLNRAPPSIR